MPQSKVPDPSTLLAVGGGNATAGGVTFQASVGAIVCSQMIAERMLDARLALGERTGTTIRFETEAPVDDVLIQTSSGGYVFVQCKVTLDAGTTLTTELGKTADEIARLWEVTQAGCNQLGWDRPLDQEQDRIVIAVGPGASGTIRHALASALGSFRAGSAPLPANQQDALNNFRSLIAAAFLTSLGRTPSTSTIDQILKFVFVLENDVQGVGRALATETLANVFEDQTQAPAAVPVLEQICQGLMSARRGIDIVGLRKELSRAGFRLSAPANYQHDVAELTRKSARVEHDLSLFEETRVRDKTISIDRSCTAAVAAAAKNGSLVIVGEPGAGKSAVVNGAAKLLRADGCEVIELAVDRLPVESLEGLKAALSLENQLIEVLENWPGTEPAFLFIDALDATRGGRSEAVFRALISDVLGLESQRWRVVASIRTFDLLLGTQFRELFPGSPPDADFVDSAFLRVRHVHIPAWSEAELSELLTHAPELATALDEGGEKLRRLAMVPFNTRLLADLISSGLEPQAFGQVGSQVELLALFWSHRVGPLGGVAEHCLRQVVRLMVERRKLQARKLDVESGSAEALDRLLAESVLIPLPGDREVAFRHHILFDYAASRVFVDIDDIPATSQLLLEDKGRGMMLAPALMFALENLWRRGAPERLAFWRAVIEFAGDSGADAIARSVAARAACELPKDTADIDGFASALASYADSDRSFRSFSHVVGALTVRLEDGNTIPLAPWCALAASISRHTDKAPWSLRTLIYILIDRVIDDSSRLQLGGASRALFWHAFSHEALGQLVAVAIGFVAKTFATDAAASRAALTSLLVPERLRDHAHEDMSWLAREVETIAASDPDFVVKIYKTIFSHRVTDTQATSMGSNRILPLTSNRRQDYEMARWSLKEAFPDFLAKHPSEGVAAMSAALEAYASEEHPVSDPEMVEVSVGGSTARLKEDHSHIWAWNPDEQHSDNAVSLINTFASRLKAVSEEESVTLANEAIRQNELSVVWSRLFMVATERLGALGDELLPWAIQVPFLRNSDTRKDALDLVIERYGSLALPVREEFETKILQVKFPKASNPDRGAKVFQQTIFGALNPDELILPDARAAAAAAKLEGNSIQNERPFRIFTSGGALEDDWWLREKGVDVEAPANALLLAAMRKSEQITDENEMDVTASAAAVVELVEAARNGTPADRLVRRQAWDSVARAAERVSRQTAHLRNSPSAADQLSDIVSQLAAIERDTHDVDDASDPQAASPLTITGRAYADAIEAGLNLCHLGEKYVAQFADLFLAAATDTDSEVRLAVAAHLTALWNNGRDVMWDIADVLAEEADDRVLSFFVGSLNSLLHADPEQVELLGLKVLGRSPDNPADEDRDLTKGLAGLVTILWVSHQRVLSKGVLDSWLGQPWGSYNFLSTAAYSLRGGLVLGYGQTDRNDEAIRKRCQTLAADIVETSAAVLEEHLRKVDPTEADQKFAQEAAQLLDTMSDQFYFASGAFKDRHGNEESKIDSVELRRDFLIDNQTTFERIGDVGTPRTIYHLIEMFEFLVPGSPELVFDLAAHALLAGGKLHGYQFESMGADRFVQIVGRFLADYRTLFEDETRRVTLVRCLEVFVEAGWPSARRLLYRLPELLR